MDIKLKKEIDLDELKALVRTVPLMGLDKDGNKIFPYKNAKIELRTVDPNELNPSTFYLLKGNVDFQREMRASLLAKEGVDSLKLDGGLEILNGNENWRLIPPIVELTEEKVFFANDRGDVTYPAFTIVKIPTIVDGANRCALARGIGSTINVLYISGVSYDHPFYALPNEWEKVQIHEEVPLMGLKKYYRRKDSYVLYRDFSVLGCGGPRYTK